MKKYLTLLLVVVILVMVFLITRNLKGCAGELGKQLEDMTKESYRLENLQISEIKQLMQIGSINFQDAIKIEKVKVGIFSDDEIIASYTCNANIGIDFADTTKGWAQKKGDSAFLKLPPIKVLNTDNKVIIRSSYPIRTGSWSNEELQQLGDSASTIFIAKAKEFFPEAKKDLKEKFKALLSMKYKYVDVKFDE